MDSFLDIMTNVVGIMILVAIVVTMNTRDISFALGIPVLTEPGDLEPAFFECTSGHVLYQDWELYRKAMKAIREEYERLKGRLTPEDFEHLLKRANIRDGNHVIEFGPGIYYKRTHDRAGDRASELMRAESDFRRALRGLIPTEHYLVFNVHADSFGVFRTARRIARAEGFAVAWNPRQNEERIQFQIGRGGSAPPKPQR